MTEPTQELSDGLRLRKVADKFVVTEPRIGAYSVLDQLDLLVFFAIRAEPTESAAAVFERLGVDAETAGIRGPELEARLHEEGWSRRALPSLEEWEGDVLPLQAAQFTVTRVCNLECSYCYQGMPEGKTNMRVEDARTILDKIQRVNPDCYINVVGGEPFAHPRIFEILELIEERGLPFGIVTNGTLLTEEKILRLKQFQRLMRVQVSMDGMTEETHNLTREGFGRTKAAVESLAAHGVFCMVSPTVHDGNKHEMRDLAGFAYENGGGISFNQCRVFPHAPNPGGASITQEALFQSIIVDFSINPVPTRAQPYVGCTGAGITSRRPEEGKRPRLICGMGRELLNIDWNGDVHPCHLLRVDDLKLGNVVDQDFSNVFDTVTKRRLRVPSTELPKCKSCDWVAECAGGCRAGAYFSYGTFRHEDDCCPSHHNGMLLALEFSARGYTEPKDRRGEFSFEIEHPEKMKHPIGMPADDRPRRSLPILQESRSSGSSGCCASGARTSTDPVAHAH